MKNLNTKIVEKEFIKDGDTIKYYVLMVELNGKNFVVKNAFEKDKKFYNYMIYEEYNKNV